MNTTKKLQYCEKAELHLYRKRCETDGPAQQQRQVPRLWRPTCFLPIHPLRILKTQDNKNKTIHLDTKLEQLNAQPTQRENEFRFCDCCVDSVTHVPSSLIPCCQGRGNRSPSSRFWGLGRRFEFVRTAIFLPQQHLSNYPWSSLPLAVSIQPARQPPPNSKGKHSHKSQQNSFITAMNACHRYCNDIVGVQKPTSQIVRIGTELPQNQDDFNQSMGRTATKGPKKQGACVSGAPNKTAVVVCYAPFSRFRAPRTVVLLQRRERTVGV